MPTRGGAWSSAKEGPWHSLPNRNARRHPISLSAGMLNPHGPVFDQGRVGLHSAGPPEDVRLHPAGSRAKGGPSRLGASSFRGKCARTLRGLMHKSCRSLDLSGFPGCPCLGAHVCCVRGSLHSLARHLSVHTALSLNTNSTARNGRVRRHSPRTITSTIRNAQCSFQGLHKIITFDLRDMSYKAESDINLMQFLPESIIQGKFLATSGLRKPPEVDPRGRRHSSQRSSM